MKLTSLSYFLVFLLISNCIIALATPTPKLSMLSDPFLQLPTNNSVNVVWFTEFPGVHHTVIYGEKLDQSAIAITTKLSQTREDKKSQLTNQSYQQVTKRDIWRHEAKVTNLTPNQSISYQVMSQPESGEEIKSKVFNLQPLPSPGTPLKILLTSDHQLMPLTAANLQKVAETINKIDAVFLAGDLVNIPDRASEWFDDSRGGAFFPSLQGKANYHLEKNGITTVYQGAEIIQNAPLFPAIGNHEVMGIFSDQQPLNKQFDNSYPRKQAELDYQKNAPEFNPTEDPQIKETWIKKHSFNTNTYQEIFTLPEQEKYYSINFGDVWLGVLYVTNMWRSPRLDPEVRGRYQEKTAHLDQPEKWGYGQHIFGEIAQGSPQYLWLEKQLKSEAFKQAKYKIVMFHHPPHTLGGNIVPPYTDPIPQISYNANGQITSVLYNYPQEKDYIIKDLMPLLETAGVQLVFYGHSHLWNRFYSSKGMNFLESSNVGNTYGAHIGDNKRAIPTDPIPTENGAIKYAATGDPNGLEPIIPSIAPLQDSNGNPLPYIASNDITVFSILDTNNGKVSSYRFDTRYPESEIIKFDEFTL